jgi:hypothetical protein
LRSISPFFLHAVNAPPAGRLRQLHLLRHFGGGQVGVVLQQAQDLAVDGAQRVLHESVRNLVFVGRIMRKSGFSGRK